MSNPIANWRRQKKERGLVHQQGIVVTWTEVAVAPPGYQKEVPYVVILVKLASGHMRYGQLVDCPKDQVKKGMKVRAVIRIINGEATPEEVITYGLKFAPVL